MNPIITVWICALSFVFGLMIASVPWPLW